MISFSTALKEWHKRRYSPSEALSLAWKQVRDGTVAPPPKKSRKNAGDHSLDSRLGKWVLWDWETGTPRVQFKSLKRAEKEANRYNTKFPTHTAFLRFTIVSLSSIHSSDIGKVKHPLKNAGARYHEHEHLREEGLGRGDPPKSAGRAYHYGASDAHRQSKHEARRKWINPPETIIGKARLVKVRQPFKKSRYAWKWKGRKIFGYPMIGAAELEPGLYLDLKTGEVYTKEKHNPQRSRATFRHERLRSPKDLHHFKTVTVGKHRVIIGCPAKHLHKGRCPVPTVAQALLHPTSGASRRALVSSPRKNPIAIYNPNGRPTLIYGHVVELRAEKTEGPHKGQSFKHTFPSSSHVHAFGLSDGTVLLKSHKGLRLWTVQ